VIGFAAETEDVIAHAQAKRARKGCDWILANDVSPGTQAFGGDSNILHLITAEGAQTWPRLSKADIGTRLAGAIARHFEKA
jgi:phosphopantothenoylcysteine decarboxylase/phosphopantothenate--cysteine ligase